MHIKVLMPTCDESRRLIDWVDGVYDAIKQGYLKNLFFGVSTDPDGTHLLEVGVVGWDGGMRVAVLACTSAPRGEGRANEAKAAGRGSGAAEQRCTPHVHCVCSGGPSFPRFAWLTHMDPRLAGSIVVP